jgi:hypothetical protein
MNADYIGLIVHQLEQTGQLGAIINHPSVQKVLAQTSQTPKKYIFDDLTEDEYIFMTAYRSFILTEDGNPFVGMANKFARYLQSVVDKAKAENKPKD